MHKVQKINQNILKMNNIFKRINQDQNKTLILVKNTIKNKTI
jgi:hypothetical protein